jgi:hypothetical protein
MCLIVGRNNHGDRDHMKSNRQFDTTELTV